MPNHSPVYQSFGSQPNAADYNPYNQQNPTLGDFINQRIGQYMEDGTSQEEATANAIQEGTMYNKGEGPHPSAFVNEWDTNRNDSQAGQLAREMQQGARADERKALEERQNYNAYATTRPDGLSFGDYMGQQYAAKQAQQAQYEAEQLARDKEMGRMYGESILGDRMNELRNLKVVDQPGMTKPTYTGR